MPVKRSNCFSSAGTTTCHNVHFQCNICHHDSHHTNSALTTGPSPRSQGLKKGGGGEVMGGMGGVKAGVLQECRRKWEINGLLVVDGRMLVEGQMRKQRRCGERGSNEVLREMQFVIRCASEEGQRSLCGSR